MHALPPFSNESAKTECRSAQKLKAQVNFTISIHILVSVCMYVRGGGGGSGDKVTSFPGRREGQAVHQHDLIIF